MRQSVRAYNRAAVANNREALMRAATMVFLAVLALSALPAAAGAVAAAPPQLSGDVTSITPVRDGCGAGWHAYQRKDRWGNWHRKCVPNRG